MCHGQAIKAFPPPAPAKPFSEAVSGFTWETGATDTRIAILPDIYGCSPFYKGLSSLLADRGADVFLVDPFHGLGDLPEATREAAFARRHNVRDKSFLDDFETFATARQITGVVGFCLGGLYIFELARRNMKANMIGLYGFPQGLPNQDRLQTPFEYLATVTQPFTMLMGREDASVGTENITQLETMAKEVPAMTLKIYEGVGHNFLPLLDSDNAAERAVAEDAKAQLLSVLL